MSHHVTDLLTPDLLRRHDVHGPRYTSYPTADRFVDAFGEAEYRDAVMASRSAGAVGAGRPMSVYVHIPYCEQLCYYCACNKIVTKHKSRGPAYVDLLLKELALQRELLMQASGLARQPVSQIHLGGGTPTFLDDDQLARLMAGLNEAFLLQAGAEVAIEVDPRTVTPQRLGRLAQLGFNRVSFGVQDFDPQVQHAVHRVQPAEQVFELVAQARALGFKSINVDLIYGLPRQTQTSFATTLDLVARLQPDRLALYAYAHLPLRFKPQRRIDVADLPDANAKVHMLAMAHARLAQAGYEYIGMDHFARPEDELARAKRLGRLHRNFQGYSTQPDNDLVGLGVSAIGKVGVAYSQNAKTLEEYADALHCGQLPVARGIALTRDDVVRRAAIMAIMCQGELDHVDFGSSHLVDVPRYFAAELARLKPLVEQGLLELNDHALQVTPLGWYFVRAVAMVFDRYLQADRDRARFSKVL